MAKMAKMAKMIDQPKWNEMSLKALFCYFWGNLRACLAERPRWERGFLIFWLLGPFILLIERTPADAWLSILALAFVIKSIWQRDGTWLRPFWVRAGFLFWGACLLSSMVSVNPVYSLTEAFIWFRFPLFAMATAFWLAKDKRLLYAMLISTAAGLLVMCGILTAEILIEGHEYGRLDWPYGDLVPGNYVTKVGMPVFAVMVALAVCVKGRIAAVSAVLAFVVIITSLMTGERINFLILLCGGMLAGLVWRPKFARYFGLVAAGLLAVAVIFFTLPNIANRYMGNFLFGATDPNSAWMATLNGGWHIAKDNLLIGIGVGNYRYLSPEMLMGIESTGASNHPHNFYLQLLAETGMLGFITGVIFLWSIVLTCFWSGIRNRQNVVLATAWVIPFGLFWPIATAGNFFGQWNSIFMWSAVALSLAAYTNLSKAQNR